jgi:hypothetical protein
MKGFAAMRTPPLLALLFVSALASVALGERIQVGDSLEQVRASLGIPTRQISTSGGVVLFYDTLLVNVENGAVSFLSRGERPIRAAPPMEVVLSPPGVAAKAAPQAVKPVREPEEPSRVKVRTWLEEAEERHVRVVAERIRRCMALDVYKSMLSQTSWRQYYEGRHWSYTGCSPLVCRMGRITSVEDDAERNDGVSFVSLKDSQSVEVPGHGQALPGDDRVVSVQCEYLSSRVP